MGIMKRIVLLIMVCITPIALYAADVPNSIDELTGKGIQAKYMGIHDPGYIVIKLNTGEIIDTTYSGIEFEILSEWEDKARELGVFRVMKVVYSNAEGVMVEDLQSRRRFNLNGVIKPHPIGIAASKCKEEHATTVGIKKCKLLELQAWDAELNRAYNNLGGKNNEKLKATQREWIKYRDAQIEYLSAEYGRRDGTIWGLIYMDHVVTITRNQTELLQAVKEW